ncbi:MAG TPA: carboxypeptidase regulatory-like domain-containing protein, partial [Bryobacteraceae bacterium]|nr:carboxypeptidase regulatory-like domain-containing protein [Bryobacteraceae bacterium]
MKRICQCVCFALLAAVAVMADPSATIVGKVTDSTGAVVPQATVSVVNQATNLERHTLTSASGDFELPLLPITGKYTLTISKTGFQTEQIPGIVLQVDQVARIDAKLNVGSISQKVTVEEAAPLVNTENATVGQVIDNKTIVDLPLNGRNFTQLATLTPGAIQGAPSGNTGFTTISVNGGQAPKTEFLLDGVSNQEQLYNGVQFTPSVDAIQEFKVLANSFSAEYGRGDAVINSTIKSGTNEFHGVLWEFLRNDAVDARNFFDNGKSPYRQNQFGGTLGGPIIHNKTFFFVNYEGTRIVRGLTSNSSVPTDAERNGDFSGYGTTIKDPLTGNPFPNNVI